MPTDPAAVSNSNGLVGRIAVWTASLVAVVGLIDAVTALVNRTQSLTCLFGISLPWCAPQSGSHTIADFVGDWTNKNPEGNITRIDIEQRLDKAVVHIWGKCLPTDCDWGTAQTPASDAKQGSLKLQWNPGFEVTRTVFTIREDKLLQVDSNTHFTDTSGRPDFDAVDYLARR
jgi:hypothetical protein